VINIQAQVSGLGDAMLFSAAAPVYSCQQKGYRRPHRLLLSNLLERE
jgi:hypothetical protein